VGTLLDRALVRRLWHAAALFGLVASAIGAAALSVRLTNANPPPLGVVIVTLDTTRADRLSVYGYMNATLPHLERLAREGVVFDQAVSAAPLTLPAHCSLFTGLLPPRHGVRDNAAAPLAATLPTLAEILQRRGFRTGAFVGSVVLDPSRGLARGFEEYRGVSSNGDTESPRQRRGDAVMTDALHWLDGIGDSPFLLWAHLYDPHRPYDPPEPYRSKHDDPYIGEIAFADAQIGRLLDDLARRNLLDRTIVVVAGDHGESLGEHGERDHGIFVYESVLHVPLILSAPNVPSGRVNDVVRLVDVMPTVLDLAGVPSLPVDGISLVGRMRGTTRPLDLEAYSESLYPRRFGWSPVRSLRAGRFKLIEAPRRELYDLETDPFEQRNLYQDRRPLATLLEQRLVTLGGGAPVKLADRDPAVAADLRRRLASLGYVASAPRTTDQTPNGPPDPKDCLGVGTPAAFRASSPACKRGAMADDADDLDGKGRP
jgi:choline-sulfatase